MKYKVDLNVKGNDSSIWGDSNDIYHITKIYIEPVDWDERFGHIRVFGDNTQWVQYTDTAIEKEIERIAKKLDKSVKKVFWSEQGMQPKKGWDFDVNFKKKGKK